jgi:2-dehydropantoate 2-reductase
VHQEARVLIVGPGAIGVLIGARLSAAGHQVYAARRPGTPATYAPRWIARDENGHEVAGKVTLVGGGWEARAEVDVLVLATKCDDAVTALRRWLPSLAPNGAVVAVQNGIIGDELGVIAGERLIECTVAFPATLREPGVSEQTGPGAFILGAWPDGRFDAASPVVLAATVMATAETTRVSQHMRGVKWTKLLINSAITSLGALTGVELGTLFSSKAGRAAAIGIVTEGYLIGLAAGIRFEKVAGFHPTMATVVATTGLRGWGQRRRAHAVLRAFGRKYRRQRSSSLQSIERGRKSEISRLNGRLVSMAKETGLAAPANEAVTRLLSAIDDGTLQPSMSLLAQVPPGSRGT